MEESDYLDLRQKLKILKSSSDKAPLSYAQQRLWFLYQLDPASSSYNVIHTLIFSEGVDLLALKFAISKIIDRHAILRSRFLIENNQPFQIADVSREIDLRQVDLKHLQGHEKDVELQQLVSAEALRPFDLLGKELLRTTLIWLEADKAILLLAFHHIIIDGWSIKILDSELKIFYEHFLFEKPLQLPELPLQYSDFAIWQRECLNGSAAKTGLSFWKTQLEDLPLLKLPTSKSRSSAPFSRGGSVYFKVGKPLHVKLKKLSGEQGSTMFMTVLAALNILLYKYTGQSDIAIGCPVSGRNHLELEGLLGFFVNTLVIRNQVNSQENFTKVLMRVKESTVNAFSHQEIPFDLVVETLHPTRDINRNPLFQVMFQLVSSNQLLNDKIENGSTGSHVKIGESKFDLTVTIAEGEEGLAGTMEYNADLFSASVMETMSDHFINLFTSIVSNPEAAVADLEILSKKERDDLLVNFNNGTEQYPKDKFVHELISDRARTQPDNVAVFTDQETLTYSALERFANSLAHYLVAKGIRAEMTVIVCMERSVRMVATHLAILRAGAVFVPLDMSYPQERIAFMIDDAQPALIIVQENFQSSIPQKEGRLLIIDEEWDYIMENFSHDPPEVHLTPMNRCYVMYTSGSTGAPKGVELTHAGFSNLVQWNQKTYNITSDDCCLQMATAAYDAYIYEIFPCLAGGASAYIIDDFSRTSFVELRKKISERNITITFMSTSIGELVMDEEWPSDINLRIFALGGEKLTRLPKSPPKFKFYNFYGPTENTVMTTYCEVAFDDRESCSIIGRPIRNLRLYILDQDLNPVPVGVHGELYIGGEQVGRGYLKRPRLTAEKFIPDPFSNEPGKRLYKTGDLVRYLPNGTIDIIGRIDHQIKLRGFRIELEEIEKVFYRHPEVKEVVVISSSVDSKDKSIIAYLSRQAGSGLSEKDLRAFVKDKLPDFMIPSFIVIMDDLPKSLNGKIDRTALHSPGKLSSEERNNIMLPATQMENVIYNVWKGYLDPGHLCVQKNFFDMGAHSLMIASVHAELKAKLGINIKLIDLFRYPSIRALAAILEKGAVIKSEPTKVNERATKQIRSFAFQKKTR